MTQRYSKYKDSGIEWIGEIPEHWEVKKLKYLCSIFTGYTPPTDDKKNFSDDGVLWVKPDNLNDLEYVYDTKEKVSLNAIRNGFLIPAQSILLCSIGTVGKMGIAGVDLITNQQINSLVFNWLINKTYSKYIIYNSADIFDRLANGNVVKIINTSTQKSIKLPVPPLTEQEAIAHFLNEKCARIDEAIRIKKKQIDLLKEYRQIAIHQAVTKGLNDQVKMKDSGIDWIGEIPEHWEVKKVKEVANLFGRIGFRGYSTSDLVSEGEGAITISPSNIEEHRMHFANNSYLSWEKYYESPEIMIFENDILIVKTGSTVGKVGIVKGLKEKATINPQLLVIKNIKSNVEYLFQYFHSTTFFDLIKSNAIGSTIPTISESKIGNLPVVIPPISEQTQIVAHLESLTTKTDEAIRLKEQQIEQLKQYKTSLINDVVTGKVRVA